MARLLATAICAALLATVAAAAIPDIPLTIQERADVTRVANHVVGGIPLPMGQVKDAGELALFKDDQPVPAAFIVREKWIHDGSLRWVTVHFLASPGAKESAGYVVKAAKAAPLPFAVSAQASGDKITVNTGAIKFAVSKSNFNILDEAWLDPTGKGKYDKPIIPAGKAKIRANAAMGKYKTEGKKASLDVIGDAADLTAKVDAFEIEENTPGRAVVKVAGQFMNKITPELDFVARLYAVAGSSSVRVMFTVINRSGKEWRDFVGINELAFEVPAALGNELTYTLSNSAGADATGPVKAGEIASILQPYSENYLLGGVAKGEGKAKSILSRRLGWADLSGKDAGVAVGIRNFWQMHPKGLVVNGDGSLLIQIVPKQDKAVPVPAGVVSQADTRVDLFTGGARTHEFVIAPHAAGVSAAGLALGVVDPLYAACATSWYCQGSRAEGDLFDSSPDNFKDEHKALIAALQKHLGDVLNECAGPRRKGGARGTEEYGLFSYGAGTESKDYIQKNDWLNTRWDGNYYDFPRATMVNFWRTGEWNSLDLSQAAGLHLADVDIVHKHVSNPKLAGMERMCPTRGHFRIWSGGETFGPSGNMDSTKSQSLYDLYHMTGDGWYLDSALLIANYCMNHTGNALRAIGNRAKGLIAAYEQTGDKTYLDEACRWLDKTLVPRTPQQKWDQNWMYGMAAEALFDLYRLTGEDKWARTAVNCCDSLIANYWASDTEGAKPLCGFITNCFGYAYQFTGNPKYLQKGLIMLKLTSEEYAGGTKTFAQQFRISPYFLVYLTKDYKLPTAVVK